MIGKSKAERYYKKYTDALDFHRPKFDADKELVAYYELEQDNLVSMERKPWVYQINTPFATDALNIRVASLQANDYTGELEPLSPHDVKKVNVLNRVQREMWANMNMDKVVDDAILQSAVVGEAYVHVIFDPHASQGGTERKNVGGLEAYFLDTSSVHIDPTALSLREATYVCVSERITRGQLISQHSHFDISELQSSSTPEDRGEIYFGQTYTPPQDADIYNKVTIYERTTKGIERTVLVEKRILEKTELLNIREIPIAQMIWQKKLKSPYGTSLMSMLLPLQKVYNEIESANANANMQYSNPSYVISRDSGIDAQEFAASAGSPGVVYEVESGVDPRMAVMPLIQNRGIDQGLVTTKQELERAIYKIAGVTEAFLGSMGTAGNTASGADMSIQRAKTIEQRILTNIEEFVEDLTTVIVEFIVNGYAGDKFYSRGEKKSDGEFEFEEFDVPEDGKDLDYTFSIELNVRTNYSKEQQKQVMFEIWQMERQYGDDEVKAISTIDLLKVMNIPQRDEIVTRYEQAVSLDSESKAELITQIIEVARELGLDAELANAAIAEIIRGDFETPALDEFMQLAQEARVAMENQEQQVDQIQSSQQMAGMQEQADLDQLVMDDQMGDQEFSPLGMGEQTPELGDIQASMPEDIENMEFMPE